MAVNHGRQVKTGTKKARAFCRKCGLDTGWIDGGTPEAETAAKASAAKTKPAAKKAE
jgi:hypothetical protein